MDKPGPHQLEGLYVLVVDDDADSCYIIQSYLMYLGAAVSVAGGGREALARLSVLRADLIISDLSMPGLNGHEFLKRARTLPGQAERPTPAIALTAFSGHEHRQQARESGFQAFLVKPVDPTILVRAIEHLRREPGGRAD
jgi:CheY-like chemotaxis protein